MERKLASIQYIKELEPISNADNIEKATVLGWETVVPKGQFKINDLVVFFEIDSLIPKTEWSSFLFKGSNEKKDKVRLKTVKLRGQVSQGLALSLSAISKELHDYIPVNEEYSFYSDMAGEVEMEGEETLIGCDISKYLQIEKYEPPISVQLRGIIKGFFPSFLKKTDEPRIQTDPELLERHKDETFYITEKLDGTSVTYYFKDGVFGVCSRRLDLKEDDTNLYWKIAKQYNIEQKMKIIDENIAIQGEIIGEGIQENKYKLKGQYLYIFNAFNIKEFKYLDYGNMMELVTGMLELDIVPLIHIFYNFDDNTTVKNIVDLSKGMSKINSEVSREGIIFRSLEEQSDLKIGRLSFKVVNPDFLLKHGE